MSSVGIVTGFDYDIYPVSAFTPFTCWHMRADNPKEEQQIHDVMISCICYKEAGPRDAQTSWLHLSC